MVMPSSGPISADIINADFGYASGSKVELSKTPFCLAANAPADSPVSMNGFYYTQSGTQQGSKLQGTGGTGSIKYQGCAVALSADGNTLAIGGYYDNTGIGATWVFTRTGTTWTQQGTKLVGTGYTGTSYQGYSVALSADGNTLVVGGLADNSGAGAVWTFLRSGGVWTQSGSKLLPISPTGTASNFGRSVSLSADGMHLAVGGPYDNSSVGAVWVFTRYSSSGPWVEDLGGKLVGTGYTGTSYQGWTVALSADATTLAVGAQGDDSGRGALWVFTRSGSVWSQQGSKLTGTGNVGIYYAGLGYGVSISADGNTIAAGGPYDGSTGTNATYGATWVFTRSGTTWSQQGSKIVGTGITGDRAFQGQTTKLSADGNVLIVGGPQDNYTAGSPNIFIGASWLFTRTGSTWTQQGSKLVASDYTTGQTIYQGWSVGLSGNANTAAVGGIIDTAGLGATWIFV